MIKILTAQLSGLGLHNIGKNSHCDIYIYIFIYFFLLYIYCDIKKKSPADLHSSIWEKKYIIIINDWGDFVGE